MLRSSLLILLLAPAAALRAAPVSIGPGSLVYSQNFDGLGTASAAWADDSLLPGWYAQINSGATAAGMLQAADGTAVLSGLLNLGAAGSPDRALGSKATGTGNLANIAYGVSFRNTGTTPLALSRVQYAGEVWRTNSGTGTPLVPVNEEYTLFYQVSTAPVTNLISGTTSATAASGAGFTALGTAADWTSPVNAPVASARDGNDPANRSLVTAESFQIVIPPGQYLFLKWTDANEAGTDGFQGIDDVQVQFTELTGALTAQASAGVRNSNGTPTNPADDTFGFNLVVTPAGAVPGAGWSTSDAGAGNPAAALYGDPVAWSGFPITDPKTATLTDTANPLYFTRVQVPPPRLIGLNTLASGGIVHTVLRDTAPWTVNETLRTLTLTNGGGVLSTVDSVPVDLAAVSGAVQFSARLTVRDTSSGFEADDTFTASLVLTSGADSTVVLTAPFDSDGSGAMNGGELAPAGGTAAAPTIREYALSWIIPASVTAARLVVSGNNNSTNETLVVDSIQFAPASAAIQATTGPVTINNQGTDSAADDTFSAPVTIIPGNNGASTGWNSNTTPASGNYADPQPVLFGPYPAAGGPRAVTLTDRDQPAVTAAFTLTPPVPSLSVSAPANITRHENGPGVADDTVSFDVIITGSHGGPRWTVSGAASGTGAFGPVTLTVPAAGTSAQVTVADVSYPAAAQTLTIPVPQRYVMGALYQGSTTVDVFSAVATSPAAEWVNDPVLRTLEMSAGGTSDKVVHSDVLDLSTAGTVWFSAVLRARETSTGSNFESTDRFKAEIIVDGGLPTEQVVNLISAWDAGDGAASGSGPNGLPNGWLNGYSGSTLDDYNTNRIRDEFNRAGLEGSLQIDNNFPLSFVIPAAASTAQLRITGSGISGSEFFTVSRILFSTVPPGADSDGDGVPDLSELHDGTDPNDPVSLFTILDINAGAAGFPTVSGRLYHGYLSSDLLTWTRDDSIATVAGDGTVKSWPFTTAPAPVTRRCLKVLSGFTPADFPATLP